MRNLPSNQGTVEAMESIRDFFRSDVAHRGLSVVLFLGTVIVVYYIYKFILGKIRNHTRKSTTIVDDFMIDLLRIPVLWLLFWIVFRIFTAYSFISKTGFYSTLSKINDILLIAMIGWILIKCVRIMFYYFEHRLETEQGQGLNIRGSLTKMKIFEGIIVAILTVVIVAVCLMTFDKVRSIGISLLTSAGIAGIIVGLAAQKSIGAVLAGIQIALTQPISLDDQVLVEGQTGNIEEITLTYVVVRLWDGRRMILPVNYFLDNTFQNWSRNTTNILGTVFLYTDYSIPVDALRKQLTTLLQDHPKWDGNVGSIQITDSKADYMEIRLLMSSINASVSFDLTVDIREKMIAFINKEYPGCMAKTRVLAMTTEGCSPGKS